MGNETRCDVQYSNGDKNNSERTRVVLLIRRGCALRTHLDMLPCAGPVRIKVNYSLRIEHTHACVGAFGFGWTLGCVQINGQPYGYGHHSAISQQNGSTKKTSHKQRASPIKTEHAFMNGAIPMRRGDDALTTHWTEASLKICDWRQILATIYKIINGRRRCARRIQFVLYTISSSQPAERSERRIIYLVRLWAIWANILSSSIL